MNDLMESHENFLKYIHNGGIFALCIYGKKQTTIEVVSRPKCYEAGIKGIDYLRELGHVRYGDPSPYKSGTATPIKLTDAGIKIAEVLNG